MKKAIKSKYFFAICLSAVICVLVTFRLGSKDENINWAQNLNANDIVKIEAISMPSLEYQRYKDYDVSEFSGIVEIINNARGKKVNNPEEIAGGTITFYITKTDGERHTFANNGNSYLVINGVSYKASYDYLSAWDSVKLDNKIPDDFEY